MKYDNTIPVAKEIQEILSKPLMAFVGHKIDEENNTYLIVLHFLCCFCKALVFHMLLLPI